MPGRKRYIEIVLVSSLPIKKFEVFNWHFFFINIQHISLNLIEIFKSNFYVEIPNDCVYIVG